MKANLKFWAVLLSAGFIFVGCGDKVAPDTTDDNTENPPVEVPDEPDHDEPEPDAPDPNMEIFRIKIDNDIMATVGTGTWNAMAYGNGRYVAVSYDSGLIAYSTNGTTWTQASTQVKLNTVAYDGEKFVALGNSVAYYSTNGSSWTKGSVSGVTTLFRRIAIGDDGMVAIGYGNWTTLIAFSTDGKSWKSAEELSDIYAAGLVFGHDQYGNGVYAAVGMARTGSAPAVYYSTDGKNWNKGTINNPTSLGLLGDCKAAYGNGVFVAVGGCNDMSGSGYIAARSTDGSHWSAKKVSGGSANDSFDSIGFKNLFVVFDNDNYAWTSVDGVDWEKGPQSSKDVKSFVLN